MTCYLIRHGKDDDTVRGGWSNASLTSDGIKQAENLAETLVQSEEISIAALFSSDLTRAKQTADILAKQLDLPVRTLPAFRETNNGLLAGMKNEIANKNYPGLYWSSLDWDERYPGGESPHEFYDRIRDAWQTFKEDMAGKTNEDVALVTHAGVINAILCIENNVEYTNKSTSFPIKNAKWIAVEI